MFRRIRIAILYILSVGDPHSGVGVELMGLCVEADKFW